MFVAFKIIKNKLLNETEVNVQCSERYTKTLLLTRFDNKSQRNSFSG